MNSSLLEFLQADTHDKPEQKQQGSFELVDGSLSEFQHLLKEALSNDVDLREYAASIENELNSIEKEHIALYLENINVFTDLQSNIKNCDVILEEMGNMLNGFQDDLGKLNHEIETLQTQSHLMNTRLKNRTNLENSLNEIIKELVISPDLIKKICHQEITPAYIPLTSHIQNLLQKSKSPPPNPPYATQQLLPYLNNLRLKTSERIRVFLLHLTESLRAPHTNIAIIQQNVFLKYQQLYAFLSDVYPEAAVEVRINYVVCVGRYYTGAFDGYIKMLQKYQMVVADKSDLMGTEDTKKTGGGLFSSSKMVIKDKSNVFSLGDRINVLSMVESGILLGHVVEEQNLKFPFEAIFKSVYRLFIDNACSEYIFGSNFFNHGNEESSTWIFNEVFDPTIRILQNYTKATIETNHDAVGLLLCIRLNNLFTRILQIRQIPCLDSYMMSNNMLFWPRFQGILDLHVESLRKFNGKVENENPHYVTRRYAEFCCSVLVLNEGYGDAILTNSLHRLRDEMETLLTRLSNGITNTKSRLVFLLNNYDLILSTLSEHTPNTASQGFDEEKRYFSGLLDEKIGEFVAQELKVYFDGLYGFDEDSEDLTQEQFEKIIQEFNTSWKQSLNALNHSIIQSFPNFQNGARVLTMALTNLLRIYKKFLNVIEKKYNGEVNPVGIQVVMVEIKKYKTFF